MYYYYVLLYPYFLSTNAIISDLMMWMYVCYCWFSLVVLAVLLPTTQSVGNVTFSYADKDQYFMISSQCLSLRVYMWGGAGYTGASCLGGGGAYVEGDLPLQQPGTSNITVKAGSSGFVCFSTGKCYGGNTASILSGGGRSAIMISNVEVVVAGGGGAGASCTNCQPPCIPGGSATSARNGTIEPTSYQGGPNGIMSTSPTQFPFDCYYSNGTKRGTFQSSSGGGGTSATVGLGGNPNGGPGKGHKGGTGVSSAYYNYVGEGGGGYFGGGGGSNNYDKTCNLGAGGGGSSYLYNLINYQNSESAGYNGIAAGMQSKYWGKGHGYAASSGDSLNGFVALECSKCVAGSAVSDVTADCVPCPPGTYITEGSTTCIPCPTGTYQSSYSSGSCKACPYGSITNAEGSTGKVDCVDPSLNFVIGCLCIILCFVGVLLYLYFGRLQRVAFQRKNRLANKCMLLFIRVINKLEAFQELMTKLMNLKYIKQLEWFDNLRNALFIILCVLLFIVTIVLVLLSAMARVIFRSTVLWRGYSFLLRLPGFLYEHLHKFLVAMDINLPYINFSLIFYPVLEVIGVIGDLKVDLGGVNITCTGSQQPVYLLINFVIAAILVIIIQSDIQLLWLHGIPDVNKTFMQMLMRKLSNCKTYLDILRLLGYTFYAMLLAIIPTPKAILQYSFGLLTFSRYFADHGVSKSNSVCDKALSVPLDSMLAYFSTALLCFAIVPTIYIIAGTIITSFTPAQIIFDDGKPSLTPYKPIQDKSEHDGKHTIVVPTDNSGGIELKTFGTTSSLDKSVEVASSTNVTTEENESASLNIMHYASQCWQTLFTPFAFDWFFLNAVTKIAIWIVRVVHSYFEDVETIVSDTSRADDAVNEIMDECKNSLNQSLPKIPWFHYFQSYSKDKAFRMEMMEEKQLWKKEIHRFPSYVHFIHAVRDELYENATSYHPIIRRVYADVFCWFPLVHWCWSTVGLGYWIRIVRNYIQFLLISFGIWNESTTRDFQLIEKYSTYLYLFEKDLINELNEINCNDVEQATCKEIESPVDKETEEYLKCERESIYVLTKAYQGAEQIQKKIESKFEETESTSAEPIDSKSLRIEEYREDFPRFLYSVVAPRLVLFQIIPALTGLSLLAVDMCACPLFVEDKVVR